MGMTTSTDEPAGGGWAFPVSTARKAHYFAVRNGRSLCGKYAAFGVDLEPDNGPCVEDCAPCRRRLEARQATQ